MQKREARVDEGMVVEDVEEWWDRNRDMRGGRENEILGW